MWIVAVAGCLGAFCFRAENACGEGTVSAGDVVSELRALEVASRKVEARIQVDQYDIGFRQASAAAPGQTPDEAVRQGDAAKALAHEIRELRGKLGKYRKEEHKLRARLERERKAQLVAPQPGT